MRKILNSLFEVTPKFLGELESWLDQRHFVKRSQISNLIGGYKTVEDEGIALTERTVLDFVGDGVTAVDDLVHKRTIVRVGAGGSGLSDAILNLSPDGLWKLNDSSGTTAADSSGGGHDMTVPSLYGAPTWGQTAGPPGTTSALFSLGSPPSGLSTSTVHAPTSGDFSAGVWVRRTALLGTDSRVMGSLNDPTGTFVGWRLEIQGNVGGGAADKPALIVGNGSVTTIVSADNAITSTTDWHLLGMVREGGVWKLYVDGLLQSSTMSTVLSGGVSDVGVFGRDYLSWAFFFGSRALSGAEWLSIYNGAFSTGTDGQVWSSTGGGTRWRSVLGAGGVTVTANQSDLTIDGGNIGKQLDYVQITANVTVSGTSGAQTTVITGNSVTYDGSTRIKIEFYAPVIEAAAGAGNYVACELWDGGTDLCEIVGSNNPGGTQVIDLPAGATAIYLTPSAGPHQYIIKAFRGTTNGLVAAGTGTGGAFAPAFLRITRA